jgi:hypothetical protein
MRVEPGHGYSGSRVAVLSLLDLLKSSDAGIAERARPALLPLKAPQRADHGSN